MIFPGQKKGEYVEFIFRKHWIVHIRAFLLFWVIGITPATAFIFTVAHLTASKGEYFSLAIIFTLSYLSTALQYALIKWLNDDLDFLVVTNERVIDITQINFLNRDVSECTLDQIQDVQGEINGFLGTMLEYGTIQVHTANDTAIFDIDTVAQPLRSASMILEFVKKGKAYHDYRGHAKSFKEKIFSLFN